MNPSAFNPAFQNSNVESKIVASLERLSQAFRVLLWNESKEHSLSPIQVQILIFLMYHSDQKRKVSYLAEEFNMTKATISDTVKTLEQKLLIYKESEPHDTRSFVIQLTKKGRKIAEKTSLFASQIITPIDKLNYSEKEKLLSSLYDIISDLNNSGIITVQRMCYTCRFYKNGEKGQEHFCSLLNTKLENVDLRLDCPDHSPKQFV